MKIRPVGVMFTSGVVISFLVGAVILYQILMSEVMSHMKEYATLKAMGYTPKKLPFIVMEEALLLVSFGFIPAMLFAWPMYYFLRDSINLPIHMTFGRIVGVFILSFIMSTIAVLLSVRKVNVSDPADLF